MRWPLSLALVALPAFAAPSETLLRTLEAEAQAAAASPQNLFEPVHALPAGLAPSAFEVRLRQDWPGLYAEYLGLDVAARQAVFDQYRRDPGLAALRAALLARSRP